MLFCGGAVFNRLSPVSKFILDSEANVALYSFVIEHLESHLKKDHRLHHYLRENHPEGQFASMINYKLIRAPANFQQYERPVVWLSSRCCRTPSFHRTK